VHRLVNTKRDTAVATNSTSAHFRRWIGRARSKLLAVLALALAPLAVGAQSSPAPIPLSDIGGKATAGYQGDALGVIATADSARLRCAFQKLEGHATPEGLWLESTAAGGGRLRLVATVVGHESSRAHQGTLTEPHVLDLIAPTDGHVAELDRGWGAHSAARRDQPQMAEMGLVARLPPARSGVRALPSAAWTTWATRPDVGGYTALVASGNVSVGEKLVTFERPWLTEEYSVSVDGVRQDFVIAERPEGAGDLRLELVLSGARAEAAAYGARLTFEGSGRMLAYSRLRVEDADGRELLARLEVLSADRLAVSVADANATYPQTSLAAHCRAENRGQLISPVRAV
jgi:hypothetical protein